MRKQLLAIAAGIAAVAAWAGCTKEEEVPTPELEVQRFSVTGSCPTIYDPSQVLEVCAPLDRVLVTLRARDAQGLESVIFEVRPRPNGTLQPGTDSVLARTGQRALNTVRVVQDTTVNNLEIFQYPDIQPRMVRPSGSWGTYELRIRLRNTNGRESPEFVQELRVLP